MPFAHSDDVHYQSIRKKGRIVQVLEIMSKHIYIPDVLLWCLSMSNALKLNLGAAQCQT